MRLRPNCIWGVRSLRERPWFRFLGPERYRHEMRLFFIAVPFFVLRVGVSGLPLARHNRKECA